MRAQGAVCGEEGDRGAIAMAFRVLFLCTHNSARSILFEAVLNAAGQGRFEAHSAGSQPAGSVNPYALAELDRRGISAGSVRSKSWDEFGDPDAKPFDLVVTVCDSAARESCPVFFGNFAKAHWGLPDPSQVKGTTEAVERAFARTVDVVIARVAALAALPVEQMDHDTLQQALAAIEAAHPAPQFEDDRA